MHFLFFCVVMSTVNLLYISQFGRQILTCLSLNEVEQCHAQIYCKLSGFCYSSFLICWRSHPQSVNSLILLCKYRRICFVDQAPFLFHSLTLISFSFSYLIASMGLQVLWSMGLACLDVYALRIKRDLHNPVSVSLFVVGDWVIVSPLIPYMKVTFIYMHFMVRLFQ